MSVSKGLVDINSSELSMKASAIGMGLEDSSYDFRLQKSPLPSGETSSMLIANAPLQATLVQYSSDSRIKREIQSVDEEAILQKIRNVKVRSYKYTQEWRGVRNLDEDVRVRGVIAQELAEVFPST